MQLYKIDTHYDGQEWIIPTKKTKSLFITHLELFEDMLKSETSKKNYLPPPLKYKINKEYFILWWGEEAQQGETDSRGDGEILEY